MSEEIGKCINSVLSHTFSKAGDYLNFRTNNITIPQLPYSLDLTPTGLFPFQKVKSFPKSVMNEAYTHTLKDLPKSQNQGTFDLHKSRWLWCVDSQGMYFAVLYSEPWL